jgi:beta-lactamase class D
MVLGGVAIAISLASILVRHVFVGRAPDWLLVALSGAQIATGVVLLVFVGWMHRKQKKAFAALRREIEKEEHRR